jgi:predicted amidohydrolase YtcJ
MAVGRDEDLLGLRGPDTAVRSLEGRTLLPGFVDAHAHLLSGGLDLFRIELRGTGSLAEFVRRVSDRARQTPPDRWLLGGGWDENAWGGPLPDRTLLDEVAPHHPVFLLRTDLHVGVANSEALRRAGIDEAHAEGDRRIDRDPVTGRLTGILREGAMERMSAVLPPPTQAERRAALQAALRHAATLGVTQIHDMGALQSAEESWASFHALRELRHAGELPLRIHAQLPISERDALARLIAEEGRGDERLRWGGAKGFVDGTLGASTAWMRAPYTHDPTTSGGPITDPEELREAILEAAALGLQPITHAIGDRAVEWVVGVYEEVLAGRARGGDEVLTGRARGGDEVLAGRARGGEEVRVGRARVGGAGHANGGSRGAGPHVAPDGHPETLRPRIEHAQHLSDELIRRIAEVGRTTGSPDRIHLSMQPAHLVDDGPWAAGRIGPERVRDAFPFRRLVDAGIPVSFGSDWTVVPMDPRLALDAAVHRIHRGGEVFGEAERVSLEEALHAHTLEGARAGGWESTTGSLEMGKWADLVVVDPSPFGRSDRRTRRMEVVATYVGGTPVWMHDDQSRGNG